MCVLDAGAVSRGMRLGGWAVDGLSCRNAQANVEAAENIDSFTALIWSAHNGHDSCLRQLLSAKVHACAMPNYIANDSASEHCAHSSVTR